MQFIVLLLLFFSDVFVNYICIPIINLIEFIYILFSRSILFLKMINHVRRFNKIASNLYLRKGSSLFHIATMLQRNGFKAPKSTKLDKLKARVEYINYRRKFIKSELTPDYLDDEALDIYIYLLTLFLDTRYEIKSLPIKEFFFLLFPYEILINLYIFFYYFFIGLIFFLYLVFFLFILIFCFGLETIYALYDRFILYYYLCHINLINNILKK